MSEEKIDYKKIATAIIDELAIIELKNQNPQESWNEDSVATSNYTVNIPEAGATFVLYHMTEDDDLELEAIQYLTAELENGNLVLVEGWANTNLRSYKG